MDNFLCTFLRFKVTIKIFLNGHSMNIAVVGAHACPGKQLILTQGNTCKYINHDIAVTISGYLRARSSVSRIVVPRSLGIDMVADVLQGKIVQITEDNRRWYWIVGQIFDIPRLKELPVKDSEIDSFARIINELAITGYNTDFIYNYVKDYEVDSQLRFASSDKVRRSILTDFTIDEAKFKRLVRRMDRLGTVGIQELITEFIATDASQGWDKKDIKRFLHSWALSPSAAGHTDFKKMITNWETSEEMDFTRKGILEYLRSCDQTAHMYVVSRKCYDLFNPDSERELRISGKRRLKVVLMKSTARITGYRIQRRIDATIIPTAWILEGSYDGKEWMLLDRREKEYALMEHSDYIFKLQIGESSGPVRWIRFIQIDADGPESESDYPLCLVGFDVYGYLRVHE